MKRRPKRSAGVYKVEGKLGTSYGISYTHPQTGQRIRKILKGCRSETAAAEIRAIEIADAARGALAKAYGIKTKGTPMLFAKMVDEYLETWCKANKEYRTDLQRASILKKAFAGKLMSDLTPWLVQKFKAAAAKEKAKTTVNKYLSLGSQVFEKAIEWKKYSGENPFAGSRFQEKRGKKPGCLSLDEVSRILAELRHQVKCDVAEFAFNTGWRISEILSLKWSEVDLDAGSAWILDQKNGESSEIELNDRALELVRAQERRGDHVFCHKNGKPFKTGIHKAFQAAAARAGVQLPKRKAWHILRRTWASMFLQSGGDVETLRVLGRWKDYKMPNWYAEAAGKEQRKRVLNKLPRLETPRLIKRKEAP